MLRAKAKKNFVAYVLLICAFSLVVVQVPGHADDSNTEGPIVIDITQPTGLSPTEPSPTEVPPAAASQATAASSVTMDQLVQNIEGQLEGAGVADPLVRRQILNSISDPYGLKREFSRKQSLTGEALGKQGAGIVIAPQMQEGFGALVAAIVVHVVETWRNTGRADWASVGLLLDSPELYAGMIGGGVTLGGVKVGGVFLKQLKVTDWAVQIAKSVKARVAGGTGVFARTLNSRPMEVTGNLLNSWKTTAGYMFAVELFAEYYRVATREVDGANSLKQIITDPHVRAATILSVLYYTLLDKQKQQEILQATIMNRAYTFDFIALTAAITIGGKLGAYIGAQTGSPVATFLLTVFGATVFGVGEGFMPQRFRNSVNVMMDTQKIRWARSGMIDLVKTLRNGIESESYPLMDYKKPHSKFWDESYFKGKVLTSDLAALRRKRDLLLSLYFKQYLEYAYYSAVGDIGSGINQSELAQKQAFLSAIEKQIAAVFWVEAVFLQGVLDKVIPTFDLPQTYERLLNQTRAPNEALKLTGDSAKRYYSSALANYEPILREYARASANDYLVVSALMRSKSFLNQYMMNVSGGKR